MDLYAKRARVEREPCKPDGPEMLEFCKGFDHQPTKDQVSYTHAPPQHWSIPLSSPCANDARRFATAMCRVLWCFLFVLHLLFSCLAILLRRPL